jgi:phosphoribosylformylglycinamidine cyclo-ligase
MERLSYKSAGVDISVADAAKQDMAESLRTTDARVLNGLGAFASLFDGVFPEYQHPVLVQKMEEPGSKQKLAFQHGRVTSLCYDLVNHLINDIAVMGATPLAVQDVIICGKLEREKVTEIVAGIAAACREQGCTLTGGETSEQPGVLEPGTYVLAASVLGVVDRDQVIDGSRIRAGDTVLAVASSGLHTNGYSLVRALLAQHPEVETADVSGQSFLDAIMTPHRCYFQALRGLFPRPELHGLAHITGGGIEGNLSRVIPAGLSALIELDRLRVLPVFDHIRTVGHVEDADMLRTFNLGVGLVMVVEAGAAEAMQAHLSAHGCEAYPIGTVAPGDRAVQLRGRPHWS